MTLPLESQLALHNVIYFIGINQSNLYYVVSESICVQMQSLTFYLLFGVGNILCTFYITYLSAVIIISQKIAFFCQTFQSTVIFYYHSTILCIPSVSILRGLFLMFCHLFYCCDFFTIVCSSKSYIVYFKHCGRSF